MCIHYKFGLNEILTHIFHTWCSILRRDYAIEEPVRGGLFDKLIIPKAPSPPPVKQPLPPIKANIQVFPNLTQ